ncbi:MAG TPA: toll/interleukin-1 receptor domain-containing protein [Pyrinomonadaceae bacterium]|nr:toll/interleukin-1 receptor domain-containing protein [Pyrinomonadaceae bacterium]
MTDGHIGVTVFANNDLTTVKGLETINHAAPSTIGVDTIYQSQGNIPEAFLRGAGLPEEFITQIPALIASVSPIQFQSCFISYSHRDEEFAKRLHAAMRAENLRVWFAPEEMKGGKKLHEQIFQAIQIQDKLLLVLSENSMSSEWVATEIRRAKRVEREENRRKLFPIRLLDFERIKEWECFDADSGKDLAAEVREYYIRDFSNWKDHDSFEREFAKLLRDLKATEK